MHTHDDKLHPYIYINHGTTWCSYLFGSLFFLEPGEADMVPTRRKKDELADGELRPYLYIGRRTELCSICIVGARCRSRAPQAWKMLLLWSWTAPLSNKTLSSEIESWSSPRAGQVRPVRVEGWRNGCPGIAVWSSTLGSETELQS